MVKRDVVQHRNFRLEQRDRTIAFIHFANEQSTLAHPAAGKGCFGIGKIAHDGAVHYRRVARKFAGDPADHTRYRRLAARPAHGNRPRRRVEQFGEQLGPSHARATQGLGLGNIRHAVFYRSRSYQYLLTACQAAAILREQVHAPRLQIFKFRAQAPLVQSAVGPGDFGALLRQYGGEWQHARTANATEEIGFGIAHPSPLLRGAGFGNMHDVKAWLNIDGREERQT